MAVLKTGGTLNKCPCGFLESHRSSSSPPSSSRLPRPRDGRSAKGEEGKRAKKGKRIQEGGKGSIDLGRVREVRRDDFVGREEVNDGHLSVTAVDGSTRTSSSSHSSGRRARAGSVASFESGGSGVSALEVYLGTRV